MSWADITAWLDRWHDKAGADSLTLTFILMVLYFGSIFVSAEWQRRKLRKEERQYLDQGWEGWSVGHPQASGLKKEDVKIHVHKYFSRIEAEEHARALGNRLLALDNDHRRGGLPIVVEFERIAED